MRKEQRDAPNTSKSALVAQVLHEFEECGDAMRYLDRNGRIAWRATARMVSRLSAAEHEAKDEREEWE